MHSTLPLELEGFCYPVQSAETAAAPFDLPSHLTSPLLMAKTGVLFYIGGYCFVLLCCKYTLQRP
jgi:hypothetical protein